MSFDPIYDTTANTLTYTIMAENGTSIDLLNEFGHSVLVIDDAFQGIASVNPFEMNGLRPQEEH
jgi:hypothetical protein